MIITNGLLMHTPIIVFEFGLISRHHEAYMRPMEIMERVQQTVFTLQESIISILYIFHTYRFLNSGYEMHTRKVVRLLVLVQVGVIAFDGGLTAFDYKVSLWRIKGLGDIADLISRICSRLSARSILLYMRSS